MNLLVNYVENTEKMIEQNILLVRSSRLLHFMIQYKESLSKISFKDGFIDKTSYAVELLAWKKKIYQEILNRYISSQGNSSFKFLRSSENEFLLYASLFSLFPTNLLLEKGQ